MRRTTKSWLVGSAKTSGFTNLPSAIRILKKKEWLKNLAKLYQYTSEWAHCDQCSGLGKCPNMLAGYQPHLLNDKGAPSLTFAPCPLKQADEAKRRQAALIKSYYVPKDTLTATFESIDKIDPGRQKAH
ncbi:hypothetical protein QS257_07590 [Terrilactibacillus sp. S3-3]|nr:hypothetical protein QS257_07590 [Terrilactibacillus sp. S3-3]